MIDQPENFVDCKCPHCGEQASFPEACRGQVQDCPNCMDTLIVPRDANETASALPLPITMPRVVLRRMHRDDWKDLLEIFSDEHLEPYSDNAPMTEDRALKWVEKDPYVKLTTAKDSFWLVIEQQAGGKVIGTAALGFDDDPEQRTFSIYVGRPFQRQGFATEPLEGILDFCFNDLSLHRLAASCDSRNIAAVRLFEKINMRREGEFIRADRVGGDWANRLYYAILADEYHQTRTQAPHSPA